MSTIKLLDDNIINKIAAGEVVERPLSVIKELVENSIDANATEITIKLTNSGIKKIIISDNGEGIHQLELPLALKRHATSKINNDFDLFNLTSLGFRGEALASISAVSKVEIISNQDGIKAWSYNNETQEIKESIGNKGTTIIVENLFYNTPVRFKHLSTPKYELSLINNFIKQMSLIYPNIKFKLYNDEKLMFETSGANNIIENISQIYSLSTAKEFKNIKYNDDDIDIDIWLCHPIKTMPNKKHIIISVNHRLIKNTFIENAIINGYEGYLHTNQFPLTFLNIEIDPSLIDVNIHPTKQQVKLNFIDKITNKIEQLIKQEISKLNFIPEFSIDINMQDNNKDQEINNVKFADPQTTFDYSQILTKEKCEWKLPIFKYIGSLYQTYLLFENVEGLYFLDQHACQERINYEKFLNLFDKKEFQYQNLLLPIIVNIEEELDLEIIDILKQLGLEIEIINPTMFQVLQYDQNFNKFKNFSKDIFNIYQLIKENKNIDLPKIFNEIATMMACKSSIKAHHYVNLEDINDLLLQLNECENPFTCPHGRPIMNKISRQEIIKLFKR